MDSKADFDTEQTQWNKKFSVGISLIDDDDHQQLLALLSRCGKLTRTRSSRESMDDIISELLQYTQTHFRREEALMAACIYPELKNHKQAHQAMTQAVEAMHHRLGEGNISHTEMIVFLTKWLVEHIRESDMAMANHCLSQPEKLERVCAELNLAADKQRTD